MRRVEDSVTFDLKNKILYLCFDKEIHEKVVRCVRDPCDCSVDSKDTYVLSNNDPLT